MNLALGICAATCFLWLPQSMAVDDPWQVFSGTESPDGRYAVAWGLPKHPDVWAQVTRSYREQAQREFEDDQKIEVPESDVENYIVDLRERKILARLNSNHKLVSNYWSLPHLGPNGHDLEVVWSRAGDIVIVNHAYRWDSVTLCAVRVSNGKATGKRDLHQLLGRSLHARFAKSLRKRGYSKESVNFLFTDIEQREGEKYSAYVDAAEGGSKNPDAWSESAVIQFKLKPSGSGVEVEVLDIHAPGKAEEPGTAEHALARADRRLNAAYSALRATLGEDARAALKLERREWLARRDKIEDTSERTTFIEARAEELEQRLRAPSSR